MEALNSRYMLAQERLVAGQTREAIEELDTLVRVAGLSAEKMTPQGKLAFDLIALAYLRLGEQENCLGGGAANADRRFQ